MIKMKALKSFGVQGDNEGHVRRGTEFPVANKHRADALEEEGLAYMLPVNPPRPAMDATPMTRREPPQENEAAHAGPLPLAGGPTGAETQPSSSPQGHQRRGRRLRNSKDTLDL